MSEEKRPHPDGTVNGNRVNTGTSAPAPARSRPTFVCESCGPDKPVEEVYVCTLCVMNYCIKHLAPMAHYCFGALGKSQTIGVSGS